MLFRRSRIVKARPALSSKLSPLKEEPMPLRGQRLARYAQWPIVLALGASALATPARAEPARRTARAESVPAGQIRGVERELDDLARWVIREQGELSAALVELESGRVLASQNSTSALNPASTTKLLTAATALAKLGVDYRFSTGVYGTIKDGVMPRLVLRSNGDPSLKARDLAALAQRLKDKGLTRVSGDIFVDQSAFDDKFVPPAYEQQPNEWAAFRAPVSAVSVDRNAIVIRVAPDVAAKRARVTVEPAGLVELVNELGFEEASK